MIRVLQRVVSAQRTSDGAGVTLYRSLGQSQFARLDPFLMLDEFGSERADEYIAGFPAHPHRGFQTVTYMLEGHMLHEDHLGNRGHLKSGGVQWMTAGRGIIHSEMPQQESGLMRGFQLWINLPAAEKMKPAAWRDIPAASIPLVTIAGGALRLIAGELTVDGRSRQGAVHGSSLAPLLADVHLEPDASLVLPIDAAANALLYLYEGAATLSGEALPSRSAALLGDGDSVGLAAGASGARLLMLAARPLHEPVVQYGPFVMNTREEIEQAVSDYRSGRLTTSE